MDITLQLLGTNDANSVFSGLQCLLAICKVYRFKANEKREEFDKIVDHCFPQLLNIGNRLVDEESLEAAEMLHTVVKAYKHAIYVGGPLGGCLQIRRNRILLTYFSSLRAVQTSSPSQISPSHSRLVYAVFENSCQNSTCLFNA